MHPTNQPEVVSQSPQHRIKKKVRFNLKVELIPEPIHSDQEVSQPFSELKGKTAEESSVTLQLSFRGKIFEASSETLTRRKSVLTDVVQQMESDDNTIDDMDSNPPQNTCSIVPRQATVFIDRDPKYFHLILFFLRNGDTEFLNELPHYDLMELEKEAQYFQIESLLEILSSKLSPLEDNTVPEKPKKHKTKVPLFRKHLTMQSLRKTLKSILRNFLNTPRNLKFEPKSRWVIWEPEKWMDCSDEAHGLRQSESCPSVFFAVSKMNVWDPSVYYSPPKGYHWATTKEFLKLVPSSFPEDVYYNKSGWKMCSWQGVTREAFLFLDTVFSHKWQHAGDCIGKLAHCKDLQWIRSISNPDGAKFTFAGIVCIKDQS